LKRFFEIHGHITKYNAIISHIYAFRELSSFRPTSAGHGFPC